MNKINYDAELEKFMRELKARNEKKTEKAKDGDKRAVGEMTEKQQKEKPKLLLHACCAPCASACIERVKNAFDVTAYFYNPNIDGKEEYDHRAGELERLCDAFGVKALIESYEPQEFFSAAAGFENAPEGGARCEKCFLLRLNRTAKFAKENDFDYFATTLTLSPLKNAEKLNAAGFSAAENYGVKYLPTDFKKRGGYLRSIELSKEFGLYRQNYCGCVFSRRK